MENIDVDTLTAQKMPWPHTPNKSNKPIPSDSPIELDIYAVVCNLDV